MILQNLALLNPSGNTVWEICKFWFFKTTGWRTLPLVKFERYVNFDSSKHLVDLLMDWIEFERYVNFDSSKPDFLKTLDEEMFERYVNFDSSKPCKCRNTSSCVWEICKFWFFKTALVAEYANLKFERYVNFDSSKPLFCKYPEPICLRDM